MFLLSVRAPLPRQILESGAASPSSPALNTNVSCISSCYSIDSSHTFTFLGHPFSDSANDSEGAEEERAFVWRRWLGGGEKTVAPKESTFGLQGSKKIKDVLKGSVAKFKMQRATPTEMTPGTLAFVH